MIPEVKTLEPQLKQILYGCVEHIQATKAALYLPASHDLSSRTFEVATSYQFHDNLRQVVSGNDDLVDWLTVKRAPFFVNGLGQDQRFAELLFRQSTDRLLAAPLFARGRMIGFIDMRDKAGKKPFGGSDLSASIQIADQLLALLGERDMFGLAPIKLVAEPPPPDVIRAPSARTSIAPAMQRTSPVSPAALRAISASREVAAKIAPSGGKTRLTERDLEIMRLILPSTLTIPGSVLAMLSVVGATKIAHSVVARSMVEDEALDRVTLHIQTWLGRQRQPVTGRPLPVYPFGQLPMPIRANTIGAIHTAAVGTRMVDGLTLTVAFDATGVVDSQNSMRNFLQTVESTIETAITVASGRVDRQRIAEKLIEPDLLKLPDLVEHSTHVASLAQHLATAIELPPRQIETVRIAALVHDVGLRLIDYDELYRKPKLDADELRAFTEHPIVGAAIVEPLLGAEIAEAVLRHHERVDGRGYPSRLSGPQIPLASRILQIADAWVSMTSASSYKPSCLVEEAAARMREAAGTQFDEQLVTRFLATLPQFAR